MYYFKNLINGELLELDNKIDIISPINLKKIGKINNFNKILINKTFNYATKAQKIWKDLTLTNRINYVNKFKDMMIKHKEELAEIITYEVGKSLNDSMSEVKRTIEFINYSIEESKRIFPESYVGDGLNVQNKIGIFNREPLGVVLAIGPYNYPLNLTISKIVPSILMGNTIVLKPATNGSITGTYIGELFSKIDLPKGVVNIVTGKGSEIGDELIKNDKINQINFTGSDNIGNKIKELANGKDLILEMGGKDCALVLDDCDIIKASEEIVNGAFSFSGQRCTAIKLVYAHNNIADKLVESIKSKVMNLKVGSPLDNANIVPLLTLKNADYVSSLIQDAKDKNCTIILEGKQVNNLIYPYIIDHVNSNMLISKEEQFGPALPIIRFNDINQVIEEINNLDYGLQASIFTSNINKALTFANRIDVGTVNINSKTQRGPDSFPFLGIKNSGVGVQGITKALLSSTRLKGIVINY